MRRKISLLLFFALFISSSFSSINVYAGTMGSIPINDYSEAFRIFYYDVDGYISGNSFYILPNPFDEDDEYDFLISGSDSSYVFATLNNNSSIGASINYND